jgi:hypothetical protein
MKRLDFVKPNQGQRIKNFSFPSKEKFFTQRREDAEFLKKF